ncbi:MAG: Kae1-associated serine/threonine protein kinase [Nanoarchaeota archaeon]|nr:Kae1-associated serine/threonine protein kinase [Nanoarchaeota archaeon]
MSLKSKIIARGAEAVISKIGNKVLKTRVEKGYRHPELDKKLRTRRTRSETKILKKISSIIPSPKILGSDNFEITMDFISGKKLSKHLDKLPNKIAVSKQIGKNIAKLHDAGIIHGDLTTSNMILSSTSSPSNQHKSKLSHNKDSSLIDNKGMGGRVSSNSKIPNVFFIDFGLGFHSDRIEDKAVDLHLISQALEAKHSKIHEACFKAILQGYKSSKNYSQVLVRLKKVESRGRYKTQY